MDNKGKLQPNLKIYSVDLKKKNFTLVEELPKLPFELKNPVCIGRDEDIIIVGGVSNKRFSKTCLSLKFEENSHLFSKIGDLNSDFLDFHPGIYDQNTTVLFSFPNIFVLKDKEND